MIQIDELQIRVPGMNKEDGAMLGNKVAERVASEIPNHYGNHNIPELKIQLKGSVSGDTTVMADRIAENIIRQIKLATL